MSSSFYQPKIWGNLEQSLVELNQMYPNDTEIVAGDLNARLGPSLVDYVHQGHIPGDYLMKHTTWCSRDTKINSAGFKLITMIYKCNLPILGDREMGFIQPYMYHADSFSSVIDYSCISQVRMDVFSDFHVLVREDSDH